MRVTIVGAGAVGGYYGAQLARHGHAVTFIARGAHLDALKTKGLRVRGPFGDTITRSAATADPSDAAPAELVVLAVKTYDNDSSLPMLPPLLAEHGTVLTLQNGVDSADAVAAVVAASRVLAGAAYIATAIVEPGVIEQTGRHRRIEFGEAFGQRQIVSPRVRSLEALLRSAGIDAHGVADGRVAVWEKLTYLAPFAGFTGARRSPIGPLKSRPGFRDEFLDACREIEALARAEGVMVSDGLVERIAAYVDELPASTRSSLLIDLSAGKRTEVEALLGTVVRRADTHGLAVPVLAALYEALRPSARPIVP
jgi:2-dehydropantoate 2-reductase